MGGEAEEERRKYKKKKRRKKKRMKRRDTGMMLKKGEIEIQVGHLQPVRQGRDGRVDRL